MTFREAVDAINAELLAGEPGNISQDQQTGYLGYSPQCVVDALNAHLGADRWRYDLDAIEVLEKKVEVRLSLSIRTDDGEWLSHGAQFGGATAGRDLTDGKKAAITDAVKKALAWWGIGNRPYRGELEDPSKARPTKQRQTRQDAPGSAQPRRAVDDAPKTAADASGDSTASERRSRIDNMEPEHANRLCHSLYAHDELHAVAVDAGFDGWGQLVADDTARKRTMWTLLDAEVRGGEFGWKRKEEAK